MSQPSPQEAAPLDRGLPDNTVKLAGQTYTFNFGLRAVLALQRLWKLKDQRAVQAHIAEHQGDMEIMLDCVWAALQTHHRTLTPDDILDLLDKHPKDAAKALEALTVAMSAGEPEPSPQ